MFQNNRPWETCATVGEQWAYKPDDKLRSIEDCLRGLVSCAIGDGNLLFNVGPRPDGLIEESHAARLREMGAFMKLYGESIYATRGGPFVAPDEKKRPGEARGFVLAEGNWWGGSTHRDKIVHDSLLGGGKATVKQSQSGIQVSVLPARRHAVDTIVKLELDGPANTIPVLGRG
jgi:alpha-L-fucosidase